MPLRTPIRGDPMAPSEVIPGGGPGVLRLLEVLAYSSGLAGAIAAGLTLIAARAFEASDPWLLAWLALSGTFVVYNLDRLRDIEADRLTSPLRTAFVERNRDRLALAVGLAGILLGVALLATPRPVVVLLGTIGTVGLFHRRLKGFTRLKATYVSLAWVAVCVGMPWLTSSRDVTAGAWTAGILFPTLAANLVASDLGDGDGGGNGPDGAGTLRRSRTALRIARGLSLIAILLALGAPSGLRPLLWVPLAEGLALTTFRPDERYRDLVLDGAILLGALASRIQLG
ncbi:MAG TPA: hypothetical protein ENI85_18265 [Deltaproteobacteria bacterium]|nr:hypothetical protein [Deltaproteobacteria bacterium]